MELPQWIEPDPEWRDRPREESACHTCPCRHDCEFAYDPYNYDVEPGVDCLAAK